MDARYMQIAADLRQRLSAGTWPVGTRFPTLRDLQDDYPEVGASTIRAAVQVLVDEGVLDTRRGVGTYVSELPEAESDPLASAVTQLHLVRRAATRALQTLTGDIIRPVRVDLQRPENPVTEVWGPMRHAHCRDCGTHLGDVTRGWVATEDYYDRHISWGGHDELEHEIVWAYGAPGDDQNEAQLREKWWERHARLQRASEEILAGNPEAAYEQAQAVARIVAQHPAIDQLGVTLAW